MAYILPLGLGVVAGVFLLVVVGEVFYLFYWRKRPLAYPRVNNVTVAPVNEGETLERDRPVVIDVTCAQYQISALHQDLVEKLFPAMGNPADSPHTLMGPPRMLFTIKEETKEELEGLDMDGKGRSRGNSRSKSMSDIPLSPMTTPFVTPQSSPDIFSTPYGTPTYSPLLNLSRSLSASPVVFKTSCRVMYDYASSPPPAPPSPTRPTFSFLARNLSPSSRSPSRISATGEFVKLAPIPVFQSPPRRHFVHHLATSPIHKQAECVVRARSPLRPSTYEYESSVSSLSPSSSPDRPSCAVSTPSDPVKATAGAILVAPSPARPVFTAREENFESPVSSPSDRDTPCSSPLLGLPLQSASQARCGAKSSCYEIEEEVSPPSVLQYSSLDSRASFFTAALNPLYCSSQFSISEDISSHPLLPPVRSSARTPATSVNGTQLKSPRRFSTGSSSVQNCPTSVLASSHVDASAECGVNL